MIVCTIELDILYFFFFPFAFIHSSSSYTDHFQSHISDIITLLLIFLTLYNEQTDGQTKLAHFFTPTALRHVHAKNM